MPTSAGFFESCGRIRSASWRHWASASGRGLGRDDMLRAFEPGLENELGSHRVEQRLGSLAVAAGFAQARFGVERRQTLISVGNRQIETPYQAFAELGGEPRHFMR